MIPYLQKLAAYEAWANEALLKSLETMPGWPERVGEARLLAVLGHLGGAKMVWLDRIAGLVTQAAIWPQMDATGAMIQLRQADERLLQLAGRLTMKDITRPVMYRNSKEESFTNALMEVVTHLVNHGTYHRGQLAVMISRAGGKAAATDYILWVREGGDKGLS